MCLSTINHSCFLCYSYTKLILVYFGLPHYNFVQNLNSGMLFSPTTQKGVGEMCENQLHFIFTLCIQTTQGVQINCFRTLEDLVLGYQHPHKGLVSPLLYGVLRDTDSGDESSGAPSGCHYVTLPSSLICFMCRETNN